MTANASDEGAASAAPSTPPSQNWAARHGSYSHVTARATAPAAPALLAAVGAAPFTRLVDIACGPGYVAGAAAALGVEALGVDLSGEMVAVARARQPAADFLIGDAEALPLESGAFHAALCNFGVLHFADPAKAFAEAFRVLKPGGAYAFSQWLGPERSPFFHALAPLIEEADPSGAALARAFAMAEPDRAEALMANAGFEAVRRETAALVYRSVEITAAALVARFAGPWPALAESAADPARAAEAEGRLDAFRVDGEIAAPMPTLVISGRKPRAA